MASSLELPKNASSVTDVDGYTRFKDVFVPMRDGVRLCADIFLPFATTKENVKAPVLASFGPYGKDIHSSTFGLPKTDIYHNMYKSIKPQGPDSAFELVDPILWTKEYGYAIVRVDTRGTGKSEGRLDVFGLERSAKIQADAEGQDLYDIIEWIGTQPWNTGKVAMAGISYYGMVGYWAAMQQPPHLTCVLSYESAADMYQASRRGGVYSSNFQGHWFNNIVVPYQRGAQEMSQDQLEANRNDFPALLEKAEYPTEDPWAILYKLRKLANIQVPFYTAGNWTDPEIHLPGNILAYNSMSSKHKWLEMHTGNHLASFYFPEHVEYEKKFLDYFLMGKHDNGMLEVPPVRVLVRHGTETYFRNEKSFPPADADDVSLYFTEDQKLVFDKPSGEPKAFEYEGLQGSVTFDSIPFEEEVEILGSPYLEVEVSTEAEDLDLFLYLRAIDDKGEYVVLPGNHDEPIYSFCRTYWRLSHRDEYSGFLKQRIVSVAAAPRASVEKGKTYSVVVPFYPTSYVFDKGYRLQVQVGSVDEKFCIPPMRHTGGDRTKERFGGKNVFFSNGRIVFPRVKR